MGDSEAWDVRPAPAMVVETHEVAEEPGTLLRLVASCAAASRRAVTAAAKPGRASVTR